MRSRWTRWWLLIGVFTLGACFRDPPTAPGLHSISGRLKLTGFLTDTSGAYAGTIVIGNADGIPVELVHGTEVVARTTTVGGAYRFTGLRAGGYVARSRVIGNIGDETSPLTIAQFDVVAADTLRLASRGDLLPVPNPFVDTTRVTFLVTATVRVDMNVVDMVGNPIKNLFALELRPARHYVYWDGRNQQGHPATATMFWITYQAGADYRACLLFRSGAVQQPTPGRVRLSVGRQVGRKFVRRL